MINTRAAVLLLLTASWCMASNIAVIPVLGGFQNNSYNYDGTLGWTFDVRVPISVTSLGYFDAGSDGLANSYPVGIWDGAGNLLISATVPDGTGGSLLEGFRFIAVSPLTLQPGQYTIGAFAQATSTDEFRFGVPLINWFSAITPGQHATTPGSALSLPAPSNTSGLGYFGPNFIGEVATVPEPGSVGLLAAGLTALVAASKRRQRR